MKNLHNSLCTHLIKQLEGPEVTASAAIVAPISSGLISKAYSQFILIDKVMVGVPFDI